MNHTKLSVEQSVEEWDTLINEHDNEVRQALRKELLEKIDSLPSDWCNEGVYTDKEMVDCLIRVMRSREEAIREIIRGGNVVN